MWGVWTDLKFEVQNLKSFEKFNIADQIMLKKKVKMKNYYMFLLKIYFANFDRLQLKNTIKKYSCGGSWQISETKLIKIMEIELRNEDLKRLKAIFCQKRKVFTKICIKLRLKKFAF